MAEWKDTCNLPRTAFAMKANLQTTEPETLARWEAMDLYGQIRAARHGAPRYLLHDGPPYANGEIHIGTALNKILKDLVVKSHNMLGFDAPYLPGWDCHGLPIELKVDRELGPKKRAMSTADFRRACRAYAEKYVEIQRRDFKRLGIIGLWDEPYLTMAFPYQAAIVRALGTFVGQDMVYKGKKPVHWCTQDRTALAEAEVEYEPHVSPSIYVEFPLSEASRAEAGARIPGLGDRPVSVLIWTTTPWTIPDNLAIAFHPDFEYGAYDVGGTAVDRRHRPGGRGGRQDRPRLRRAAGDLRRQGDGGTGLPPSRSMRATRSACSVTTSRWTPAPARSTPPRATAPTTTTPASSTGWRSTPRSTPPAATTTPSSCSPGCRSGTRTRRSRRRWPSAGGCGTARTITTSTRTAGAATSR